MPNLEPGINQSLKRIGTILFGLSLLAVSQFLSASDLGVPVFRDVTEEAGIRFQHVNGAAEKKDYIFEAKGGGIGFFDYDNDGWLDIYLVQGSSLEEIKEKKSGLSDILYRNLGNGRFEDVTAKAGIKPGFWGMGVAFADIDNDGYVDIYRTNLGPDILYRNRGDGSFEDITAASGIRIDGWSTSAAFGDYDKDGFVDLYVARYLDYGPGKLPPKTPDCTYLGVSVLCGPRGLAGAGDYLFRNKRDRTFFGLAQDTSQLRDTNLTTILSQSIVFWLQEIMNLTIFRTPHSHICL